jgi:hypothetical protein
VVEAKEHENKTHGEMLHRANQVLFRIHACCTDIRLRIVVYEMYQHWTMRIRGLRKGLTS